MNGLLTIRTLIQRCQSTISNHINPTTDSSPTMVKFYKEHCIYLPAMLGWFLFSALLSLYNKYVFGDTHLGFPCPLLMTSIHFLSQWFFAYITSTLFFTQLGGDQIVHMSWKTFLSIAIPCGFVTSADVGFSNLALVRISVTFYTMVKASSPIFVVLSAYMFGIEKITLPLIGVVVIISLGELLTVLGEVQFDMIGFILCFVASVLSGMRWTVVQLKLQSLEPKLKSTIGTMRILSPLMFITMLIMSLVKEQPWRTLGPWVHTPDDAWNTLGLSVLGATLAICMMLCEFYLIMKSNAIVLMIGGVLKELNTIALSVVIFGDKLNAVNALGCVVVFSGVILYKVSLHLKKIETKYDAIIRDRSSGDDGDRVGNEVQDHEERNESNYKDIPDNDHHHVTISHRKGSTKRFFVINEEDEEIQDESHDNHRVRSPREII